MQGFKERVAAVKRCQFLAVFGSGIDGLKAVRMVLAWFWHVFGMVFAMVLVCVSMVLHVFCTNVFLHIVYRMAKILGFPLEFASL